MTKKNDLWGIILKTPPDGIDPRYPTGEFKEEWLELEVNLDDATFFELVAVDASSEYGDFVSAQTVENTFKEIIMNPFSYPNTTVIFEYR